MGWITPTTRRRTMWAIGIGLLIGLLIGAIVANDNDAGARVPCVAADGDHTPSDAPQFLAWLTCMQSLPITK